MVTIVAILFLIAGYAAMSLYVHKATEYLKASEPVWDRLYDASKVVVSDPDMPGSLAAFSAAAVLCAGCGCLTRRILQDILTGQFKRQMKNAGAPDPSLTHDQRQAFARVVILAIYYDSLRAPLLGFVLRRIALPWLPQAASGRAAPKSKIAKAAASSREAIREKAEGRRVLSMA